MSFENVWKNRPGQFLEFIFHIWRRVPSNRKWSGNIQARGETWLKHAGGQKFSNHHKFQHLHLLRVWNLFFILYSFQFFFCRMLERSTSTSTRSLFLAVFSQELTWTFPDILLSYWHEKICKLSRASDWDICLFSNSPSENFRKMSAVKCTSESSFTETRRAKRGCKLLCFNESQAKTVANIKVCM